MTNNRTETRTTITSEVMVIDLDSGKHIGNLLNISTGGLMLLGTDPIELDKLYQLEIQLASPVNGLSTIQVGADSLWSNPSSDSSTFWTGFQIIDISDDSQRAINQLTNDD
ncbi:MAG: PilZ domain-containing protein [Pseudomonadales bacterium]|nr:PilZ domain-containing protein [Pseudomonadales bacterium]